MLTFRGVSEANENDWTHAKQDFLQAYSLNPDTAFTLNNLGYVAEKDGDLETAEFYYSKARKAEDAKARIGVANRNVRPKGSNYSQWLPIAATTSTGSLISTVNLNASKPAPSS